MRKNTKAILVFLCALVMVLTGIGMPVARAEQLDSLTVDSIFDGLGAALQYGTVAREWDQNAHAETNACVDVMDRYTNTIFSNTGSTYFHAMGYELQAEVSAPETLKGMTFGLFKEGAAGTDYVLCAGTEITVTDDTTATTLTWDIGDKDNASVKDLKNTRLFVMQVENGTYIKDGTKNEAELIVTYGPSVSASAYNTNYIGKMFYRTPLGEGDSVGIFNTTEYSPGIEFGPETRLYQKVEKRDENNQLYYEYVVIDPNDKDLDVQNVLVNYYYGDMDNPTVGYAKLDGISFKDGVFSKSGNVIEITYKEEKGYATSLVNNAKEYSAYLGNLGGGEITSLIPNPNGGSTVTGPVDAKGNVVSVYDAEVGADGVFQVKADMGWDGIPVAENEYVIINVICPSKDGKVTMGTSAGDITYFYKEGQAQGEGVAWGAEDSNSSQRVIFNFVYADENGIMQPYAGTVEPTARHGGTLLAPSATVVLNKEVHNGSIIADTVNNGQEIHQRCFAAQARSTWVRMDCGTLWLQKASVGYNWNTKPYGKWEDMSSKVDLSGAVFGVYSKKDCKEDSLVMTMTTDAKGVATSELLSAGKYWVKEITPLKDHNLIEDAVEVTVVAGEPTQVKGAGYKVKPSNGQPGYEVVKPGAYANQQNNGFTSLRLVKNDEFGNVLQGAEFTIYRTRHYNGWTGTYEYSNELAKAKTNRNGVALFENVPLSYEPVTYYIMETAAPEGYKKSERVVEVTLDQDDRDKIVTIDGNGNAAGEAFINEIIRGNMALKKVNAADSKIVLEGAEFTIYSDKACTKIVGVMTTGKNGIATSKGIDNGKDLIPGTYYVKETKAPDGYKQQLNNSVYPPVPVVYTVDVKYGKMVDVVTNKEIADADRATGIGNDQYIHISGEKRWYDAEFDVQRPQQVTIELYRKKADGSNEWIAKTNTSAPEWKFDFEHVELPRYDANGKEIEYIIRENLNGNQYYYAFVKQTEDKNGNITAIVSNSVKTTKVVGNKEWEDKRNDEHPEKITFLLFVDVNGELVQVRSPYDSNRMYTVDGMRHENYRFTFENLPTYDVNGDPAKYVVKEADSDNYHVVKSVSESETEGNQTTVTITLTNRLTVPLKGTKTWDDGGRTNRPEVVLDIYRNNEMWPLQFTGPFAISGVEIIWDKETDTDVWTWKVVGLPKYDMWGNLNTYRVEERQMPGYEQKVTTDENGIHFTNTLKGVGRIRLYKENEAGERLNGVEFGLYTDPNCTPESRVDGVYKTEHKDGSNEDGKLEIKDIPYGTYYLKEETTPEGYVENTKIYKVEVYKPSTEPSDIENGDKANTDNPNDPNPPMNVVVNKKAGETTSITVLKHWPTSEGIDVSKYLFLCTLDADGKPVKLVPQPQVKYTEVQLPEDVEHHYTWSDLPKCDDKGNEIKYVVIEEGLEGYFTSYDNGNGGSDSYAGNGGVIVNRVAWDFFRISKNVTKYNGAELPTDKSFDFTITPDEKNPGKCELRQVDNDTGIETKLTPDEKGVYTVSLAADEWSNFGVYFPVVTGTYTFVVQEVVPSPLPDNWAYDTHTYTVTFEVADDGSVEMSQSGEDDDVFTNKYYGTTELEITKYWEFDTAAMRPVKPETFAQYLTLRYAAYPLDTEDDPVYDHEFSANEWKEYTGITPSVEVDDVIENEWVITYENLPRFIGGKVVTWSVVEEGGIPGYVVSYEPMYIGEDADQEVAKDFAFAGETITNTYYETKGKVEFDGVKVLNGRDMKAGEFTFILTDKAGNELQRVTNAADGTFAFEPIKYTEKDVPYGKDAEFTYYITELAGDLPGVTYDTTKYEIVVGLWDDEKGTIHVGDISECVNEIVFTNTYEEKVYEAKGSIVLEGTKVLEGRTLKDGEFTFEVKDAADKVIATGTNKADGKITFSEIKYTEKDAGKTYTYKVYEIKGDLPGVTYVEEPVTVKVTVTDNGDGTLTAALTKDSPAISFKNTYEAEGAVTFKGAKFLMGREFKQGDEFTFELLNEKGDVIDTVTINPTSGTKADFAFKTIKYELADAGKTYTYTYRVKEKAGTEDGMTYDDTVHTVTVTVSDAGDGSLKVVASDSANKLNFTNTYLAEGSVLFSGTKTMNGKALVGKDFTFVLTDADGKEIETVTNDKDGKIVFSTIQYDLEDVGKTFTYKVSEKNDGKKAVTYDDTVYTVTVKVEDTGDGHLKVTASDNAAKLNFTNSYEAKAVLTMNAYKTVNGYKPSVDQVYDFVLLCDDGAEMTAQNKDENIIFGTLTFNEDDIGKTFIYTVKETTEANELLEVDTAIYQVAVTVVDNGDGNLKLETEFLKDGKRASGVVFANTATATLAISKTVKGPGPDKAFDLKVTFIGVDGKELEGVYDYDGDVKGTITSGGVIALKDGQSVTIVGLPEGATYTVEENAGPAYTVTVNGKPIAKAEGTLVGHGKLEFINTVETTTFSVTKVWEGMDLGEITLTLYADGKQITPQPEVTREGNKYTYYNLPKYNEEGEEIVYSAKERGIDGYIRIYNNVEPYQDVTSVIHDGGTIINREIQEEVHELSFKIRKVWTGVEATEEIPAITLTLYCNGEKLDVPTPKPNSEGWYKYYDLPKTVNGQIAVYTVVEEPIPGYTVTYKTASGEIVEEGVNGGEIINAKIPQTGDPATLGLWLALMGASAVLLTMLQRRRKA